MKPGAGATCHGELGRPSGEQSSIRAGAMEGAHAATLLCPPAATGHDHRRGARQGRIARPDRVRPRQLRPTALAAVRRCRYGPTSPPCSGSYEIVIFLVILKSPVLPAGDPPAAFRRFAITATESPLANVPNRDVVRTTTVCVWPLQFVGALPVESATVPGILVGGLATSTDRVWI